MVKHASDPSRPLATLRQQAWKGIRARAGAPTCIGRAGRGGAGQGRRSHPRAGMAIIWKPVPTPCRMATTVARGRR